MFRLPSAWVWDFWIADDGDLFHLFFLKASRALLDPDRRHWRATVGHATSTDLTHWVELPDALIPSDGPAFDDLATWTGSVVQDDDGLWHMFYTGVDRESHGLVQRIGHATSRDLTVWERPANQVALEPAAEWYENLATTTWPDQAWRDPWVFRDPAGDGWRMLITARANHGSVDQRGVIGQARSTNLSDWSIDRPLSEPDSGFGQLEVLQSAVVDGRAVVIFSCLGSELSAEEQERNARGGIFAVNATSLSGPFDVSAAYRIADERLYVGRLIQDRHGGWQLLAFRNTGSDGSWIGDITDPMPVSWSHDRLSIAPLLSGLDELVETHAEQ